MPRPLAIQSSISQSIAIIALHLCLSATAAPARIVLLDPGHDPQRPGICRLERCEAELSYDLALRIQHQLHNQPSLTVRLTRRRDEPLPPEARIANANAAHGDLFLSLHAVPAASTVGGAIIRLGSSLLNPVATRADTRIANSWVSVAEHHNPQSDQLSELLLFFLNQPPTDFRLRQRQLPANILVGLDMPGLLLELPVSDDSAASLQRTSIAIAKGIQSYLGTSNAHRSYDDAEQE